MTKSEYRQYLASAHWQETRKEYLVGVTECKQCDVPRWIANIAYDQDLHVHHLSYANLGSEDYEDLEALCRRCHEIKTFGHSNLRAPKTFACANCTKPAYDIYPYGQPPLCFICAALDEGTPLVAMQAAHWRTHRQVWKEVLRCCLIAAGGFDEVLDECALIEKEHQAWLEQRKNDKQEEVPF